MKRKLLIVTLLFIFTTTLIGCESNNTTKNETETEEDIEDTYGTEDTADTEEKTQEDSTYSAVSNYVSDIKNYVSDYANENFNYTETEKVKVILNDGGSVSIYFKFEAMVGIDSARERVITYSEDIAKSILEKYDDIGTVNIDWNVTCPDSVKASLGYYRDGKYVFLNSSSRMF